MTSLRRRARWLNAAFLDLGKVFSQCNVSSILILVTMRNTYNLDHCMTNFFRECDSEWLDCIAEDEKYLQSTTLYDKCKVDNNGDPRSRDTLKKASQNKCFSSRRCEYVRLDNGDTPYAGFDPSDNCTCSGTDTGKPSSNEQRLKRQTGEKYRIGSLGGNCRVVRTKLRRRFQRCDKLVNTRSQRYKDSIQVASNTDPAFGIDEDLI